MAILQNEFWRLEYAGLRSKWHHYEAHMTLSAAIAAFAVLSKTELVPWRIVHVQETVVQSKEEA